MFKSVHNTWSNNHGWLLSGAGVIVALAACLIWYLDWIPRISLTNQNEKAVVSQSIQKQNAILVAQIVSGPEQKGAKGRILLFLPSEDQRSLPTYQERFILDDRGMASLLLVVPAREYSMIAFIDANDNGQLDFDDQRATEDFRLPKFVSINDNSIQSLGPNGITLPPQIPCLCVFDFSSLANANLGQ